MKNLCFISLIFSTIAFSCPNLSGKYRTCISRDGDQSNSKDITITQSLSSKITTYIITATDAQSGEIETTTMIADGKVRTTTETDPSNGLIFTEKQSYSCKDNILNGSMILTFDSTEMLNIKTKTSKVDNTVTIQMKGTSMDQVVDDLVTCK